MAPRVVLAVASGRPAFFDALIPDRGLATLAAVLTDLGVEHRVVDLNHPRTSPGDFLREMREFRPDVVGFKFFDTAYAFVEALAGTLKQELPGVRVVAAGPHPTLFRETILELTDSFDLLVYGEGERAMPALIEWVEGTRPVSEIPGAIWRSADGTCVTNPQELVHDLDALPFPKWDVFPLDDYLPIAMLNAYRGCPYTCGFCAHNYTWGYRERDGGYAPILRKRSIGSLQREIDAAIDDHGLRLFGFCDSIPLPSLWRDLAHYWATERPGSLWTSFAHVGQFVDDDFALFARSGCVALWYGVESGSESLRRTMGKHFSNADVVRTFASARAQGIVPIPGFIIGFPGETAATVADTWQLVAELDPPVTVVSPFILDPGTPVSLQPERYGVRLLPDWKRRIALRDGVNEFEVHYFDVHDERNVDHWERLRDQSRWPGFERDRIVAESEYAYLIARAAGEDPAELVLELEAALKTSSLPQLRRVLRRIWAATESGA